MNNNFTLNVEHHPSGVWLITSENVVDGAVLLVAGTSFPKAIDGVERRIADLELALSQGEPNGQLHEMRPTETATPA